MYTYTYAYICTSTYLVELPHLLMTCLESVVGFAEISQWPLDLITRFLVHVSRNGFTVAFAYDMFGIFCEICRNQSMAPRCYYSDSCTCERAPVDRQRQKQRQIETDRHSETDRQTDRERDRESQTGRLTDIKTQRDNKKDIQTNRSIPIWLTLSRSSLSMLNQVLHALEFPKPSILSTQKRCQGAFALLKR